jgi:hypothetical protein
MEAKLNLTEIVKTAWEVFKLQVWLLVGILIAMSIISFLIQLISISVQGSTVASLAVSIISLIISSLFTMGYLKNHFQALDGDEPQFSAYGQQAGKLVTYIASSIIYGIVVTIGLCLLIIPGIYIALRLQFYTAYIVEEDAGILDSLQRSWELTQNHVLSLFLLALIMMLFIFAGIILLGIGILVAIPLCYIMFCTAFRKLNMPLTIVLNDDDDIL